MIRFACNQCDTVHNAPDDAANKSCHCKKCGKRMRVPASIMASVPSQPHDEELIEISEVEPQPQPVPPRIEPPTPATHPFANEKSPPPRSPRGMTGIVIIVIGILITILAIFYDTVVESFEGTRGVYNIGLMNNRIVLAIIGCATTTCGVILLVSDLVVVDDRWNRKT